MLYTFPQSVGIAGGRPASSYYFVGSQADSLFYLDPHHARPAVPLRPPPPPQVQAQYAEQRRREDEATREGRRRALTGLQGEHIRAATAATNTSTLRPQTPASPTSVRSGASSFSYHTPVSPSPLQHQFSGSSTDTQQSEGADTALGADANGDDWEGAPEEDESRSPPPSYEQHGQHRFAGATQGRSPARSPSPTPSITALSAPAPVRPLQTPPHTELQTLTPISTGPDPAPSTPKRSAAPLNPLQLHYCNAYAAADLATFHCTRVRKMAVTALDPSMLLGFVVRDADDWADLRRRVGEVRFLFLSIFRFWWGCEADPMYL